MCRFEPGPTLPAPVRAAPDILVIEDELLVCESLQDALEEAGHRVVGARNGAEALVMLDRMARPALLVLDLQMPVMDGLTFLSALRSRPDHEQFEVLAMSALVNGEWLEHIPGVLRTLRKPFDIRELLAEVEAFETRHTTPAASVVSAREQATPVLGAASPAAGPEKD